MRTVSIMENGNLALTTHSDRILANIRDFAGMAEFALKQKPLIRGDFSAISNVVISGVGGSGIAGDIARDAFEDMIDKPVVVNRKPTIPAFADERTLFVPISYSGDTVETVAALEEALRRGCKIFGITSRGAVERILKEHGLPYAGVKKGYRSREALPLLLFALVDLFGRLGWIERDFDVGELKSKRDTIEGVGRELAGTLYGKTAIICTAHSSVGRRFKSDLNENAKIIAKYEVATEFCHNELNAWLDHDPKMHVVLLRDRDEAYETAQIIDASKRISKIPFTEICAEGSSKLSRMLYHVWLGEFTSYYLAVKMGVDLCPLPATERLKEELLRGPRRLREGTIDGQSSSVSHEEPASRIWRG